MSRLTIIDTPIQGLSVIQRRHLDDARGFLTRIFCADELSPVGWTKPIAQINQTLTHKRGAIRGMHYQHPPGAEMKLVSCLKGKVWDVAVDIREDSPTFLQWHAEELSEENLSALLIPEGFAHGFQTLTDHVELLYLHSAPHSHQYEAALNPEDPSLAIAWPMSISEMSQKDKNHPLLNGDFKGIAV